MYQFPGDALSIDHVPGDPFASPSKVSVHVKGTGAGFPKDYFWGKHQRIALQDELTRQFGRAAERISFRDMHFRLIMYREIRLHLRLRSVFM